MSESRLAELRAKSPWKKPKTRKPRTEAQDRYNRTLKLKRSKKFPIQPEYEDVPLCSFLVLSSS